jgi:hypothetical protein
MAASLAAESAPAETAEAVAMPPLPDDPGVVDDEDEATEAYRRLRLV